MQRPAVTVVVVYDVLSARRPLAWRVPRVAALTLIFGRNGYRTDYMYRDALNCWRIRKPQRRPARAPRGQLVQVVAIFHSVLLQAIPNCHITTYL